MNPSPESDPAEAPLPGIPEAPTPAGPVAGPAEPGDAPAPLVVPPSGHPLRPDMISPEALKVLRRLDEAGYKGYLCGGGVRDLLLGIAPKDFDVATDARPEEIKRVFRNCRIIGRRFRLAHVFFRDVIIETATFRALLDPSPDDAAAAEGVALPSRRNAGVPDPTYATRGGVVVRDNVYGTPSDDARRRDFTVNGLFYDIATGSIIDYVGGLRDLSARVLRVIGDPAARFHEDPVRMIRAVRIASQLGFAIEPAALDAIRRQAPEIAMSSRERLYEEMLKIRNCGHARDVFDQARALGIHRVLHPAFDAWLDSPSGTPFLPWVRKAYAQFDIWKRNRLLPLPPLQYALMLGPCFEDEADRLAAQNGLSAYDAMLAAVPAVMRAPGDLTQIPKNVILETQRIMALQVQMRKSTADSRYADRLRQRYGFDLAAIYLKFAAALDPARKPLLDRWLSGGPIPTHDYPSPRHRPLRRPRR